MHDRPLNTTPPQGPPPRSRPTSVESPAAALRRLRQTAQASGAPGRLTYRAHCGTRERLRNLRRLARERGSCVQACARCRMPYLLEALTDDADGRMCCSVCLDAEVLDPPPPPDADAPSAN